ncbi:GTPase ObgE [bacterium]|nr:GTPase ObgE [bacterium]
MFIDRVKIFVKAGAGGKGVVSFHRAKFVPKGGPDGGNGGKGGDVILRVDPNLGTLLDLRYKSHIKASSGKQGGGNNMSGRGGEDEIVRVPPGTIVFNQDGKQIIDLLKAGEEYIIARGGRGGKGNASFAGPTKRTPRYAQPGEPGEELEITLELKLLADVGFVGLPNAGKSTLLSVISAARPEVAAYPFTTLKPHLGMVQVGPGETFIAADIPGLIEGAADGKGLGHQFLRHIERTRVLVILIDITEVNPDKVLDTLLNELGSFNPELIKRPQIIIRTKMDMAEYNEISEWQKEEMQISAVTGANVDELKRRLFEMVKTAKSLEEEDLDI